MMLFSHVYDDFVLKMASVNRFSSYGFRRTFSAILRRNAQIVCKCSKFRFIWTLYAFILPLFCFTFVSFDCVILLPETYLYVIYFDEPALKTLKITNRFRGCTRFRLENCVLE